MSPFFDDLLKSRILMAKKKAPPNLKIGKARKSCVTIRTYRTLNKRRIQRNEEVGCFTKPSFFVVTVSLPIIG